MFCWLVSGHKDTCWLQESGFLALTCSSNCFPWYKQASIRDLGKTRSLTSKCLEGFSFPTAFTWGRWLIPVVCSLLTQTGNVADIAVPVSCPLSSLKLATAFKVTALFWVFFSAEHKPWPSSAWSNGCGKFFLREHENVPRFWPLTSVASGVKSLGW